MGIKKIIGKVKTPFGVIKPVLKGLIMVLIGIIYTRPGVGIGRLSSNLIFGLISYLFIGMAALFLIQIIKMRNFTLSLKKPIELRSDYAFGFFTIVGILIVVLYWIFYNLDIWIIIVAISTAILFDLLCVYALKERGKSSLMMMLISTLIFTVGIIYGAALNSGLIYLSVWFFFSSASFLQMAREFVKTCIQPENVPDFAPTIDKEKALTLSKNLQIVAFILMFVPLFLNLINFFLYLYFLIAFGILMAFSLLKTSKSKSKDFKCKNIAILLKWAIFVQLLSFLIAGA